MNTEERQQKLNDRKKLYYSLDSDLYSMREKLKNLEKHRGQSLAFKMLIIAIDMMTEQVRRDFSRYEKRISAASTNDNLKLVQASLNREKVKNAALEKKIEEAKTSSGLFIDFVREKLNIK